MKIVNICLSGSYNYGWGYHDNLISKYQKKNGNEVTLITSRFVNDKNSEDYLEIDAETRFDNGVKVIRLEHGLGKKLTKLFRIYKHLYKTLENENPDFIFIHCSQFLDALMVCRYLKKHKNVACCVDNHADYTNSALTPFAKFVHKTLWKYTANKLNNYASLFYGVIPIRCDFLNDMYGIPKEKIKLLVMGADDELVEKGKHKREEVRSELGYKNNDFVIITGGKIDLHKKGILNLMKVVNSYNDAGKKHVKLLVFGSVVPELKEEFDKLIKKNNYLGWVDQENIYNYLCAADLAAFPGRHSVIWEQAVGCGLPSIFLDLPNTHHIDVNGNCLFFDNDSEDEIKNKLDRLLNDETVYMDFKNKSIEASKSFSYKELAKRSISETIASNKK